VGADAEQFEGARCLQYHAPMLVIVEQVSQVMQQERWSFDADQVDHLETAGDEFGPQLTGPVRIAAPEGLRRARY
jgi:hypothetical protein